MTVDVLNRFARGVLEFMKYFSLYSLPAVFIAAGFIAAGAPAGYYPAASALALLWTLYNGYGAYKAFKKRRFEKAAAHIAAIAATLALWTAAHVIYLVKQLEIKRPPGL